MNAEMKKKTEQSMKGIIRLGVALLMAMPPLALTGCSSAEDAADPVTPETPETPEMLKMTLSVENRQTRMIAHDDIDNSKGTFSYEWQVGDTLRLYDPATKKQGIVIATTAGNPATFEGTIASTDINDGDKVSLISSNCVINTADGTASVNIANQVGTLDQVTRHTMFYGTTKATKTGTEMTLGTCSLEQKMAILRMNCIFNSETYAKLAAFSMVDAAGAAVFSKEATCDLTTGDITKTSTLKPYVRATFNEIQQPAAITDHDGYYAAKVYLVVVPAALPAVTVNAFCSNTVTYNENMDLSSITLKPNDVQPVTVNYCKSTTKHENAISCPGFMFSLSPGVVIAYRNSIADAWQYKFGADQGDVRGMDTKQSDTYGIYFTWGSVNPMDVRHEVVEPKTIVDAVGYSPSTFQDVAAKCGDGKWRMPTSAEMTEISNAIKASHKYEGKFKDGGDVNGVFVGTNTQPTQADQNNYFFFPYTGDLHYTGNKNPVAMTDGKNILYFATPPLYSKETVADTDNRNISLWCGSDGTEALDATKAKSGFYMAYRLQYNFAAEKNPTAYPLITNGVETRQAGYGRVIRGVRY
jgi:hypothetical protein